MAALLACDPDALILAEDDGELIGSVIAGWDGWRFHLYRLAVRPAWVPLFSVDLCWLRRAG